MRVALSLILMFFLCSCGSQEGVAGTDEEILREVNGEMNDGFTVRFSQSPIKVYVENIPEGRDEVRSWTEATDGLIEFEFVSARSEADIKLRYGAIQPLVCGVTYEPEHEGGEIKVADIEIDPKAVLGDLPLPISILDGPCQQTVRHEVGHALGFFGHTRDGGLMDPDGGSGQFSSQLISIMKTLYSNPPNTSIDDIYE